MLRVPTNIAKPGMVLALPIFHPRRPDTMLLKAGMALDARNIGRLREIKLREVWIRYPGVQFAREYICPMVFEAQASLTWQVARALEAVTDGSYARLDYHEYRAAIGSVLSALLMRPGAAVFIQELAGREEPHLRHASSVCLISLLMGLKLEDYLIAQRSRLDAVAARDVTSLGLGAMLHDVGMLRLDAATVRRWHATLDESDPDWRRHVNLGHELVKDHIGPSAAAGVLHHHQKFDGSGFPRRRVPNGSEGHERIRGSDIHVFARIIAGADLYDRLRWPADAEEGAAPTPVVRVLNHLRSDPYRRWLDPMVFRALLAVVPAYAPGTTVDLSNGRSGVVVEWFPEEPCRPTVQTLPEPHRHFSDPRKLGERFVLRDEPDLFVVRAEDQDVAADNFFSEEPGEFDLRLAIRSIENSAAYGPDAA